MDSQDFGITFLFSTHFRAVVIAFIALQIFETQCRMSSENNSLENEILFMHNWSEVAFLMYFLPLNSKVKVMEQFFLFNSNFIMFSTFISQSADYMYLFVIALPFIWYQERPNRTFLARHMIFKVKKLKKWKNFCLKKC